MRWSTASSILMLVSLAIIIFGAYNALIKLPESTVEILKNNYRIIFFHVPSAVTSFVAFTVTLASSIAYLKSRRYRWDIISVSSARAGFFFITAALVSGSIWAKVTWGSYWNWDPRETTVLILWFAYAAYFALRASIENPEEKAKSSSILAIFAYVTVPLSYLSSRIYFSLHPSTPELILDVEVGATIGMMITGFILAYLAYFILDVKLSDFELKIREVE
jgi:heme exporter protein C